MPNKTIIYDDREKTPWVVSGFNHERKRMDFGDYTIKGMEQYLRIERKHGWSELMSNLVKRESRDRLWKNIERLGTLGLNGGIVAVLVEDNPVNLPLSSAEFTTMGLDFRAIVGFCNRSLVNYGVPVIPVGKGLIKNHYVDNFFKGFVESHKKGTAWYKGV